MFYQLILLPIVCESSNWSTYLLTLGIINFKGGGVLNHIVDVSHFILIWVLEFEFNKWGVWTNMETILLMAWGSFISSQETWILWFIHQKRRTVFKSQNFRRILGDQDWDWFLEVWAAIVPVTLEFSQVTAAAFVVSLGTSNFSAFFV